MKRNVSVICYLIVILIISACGPGQLFGPTVTPTATPSGPFPVGDYKAVSPLRATDLSFLDDDTFTLLLPSEDTVITGTYVVTADKIVLNENPYNLCSGYPGTYTWSFDGETLTLEAVEDKCDVPRQANLSRAWTRQP